MVPTWASSVPLLVKVMLEPMAVLPEPPLFLKMPLLLKAPPA